MELPFRSVADSLVDPVVGAHGDSNITYTNAAAREVFGYADEHLEGEALTVLMPERYRGAHTHGFGRFAATGEGRVLGKRLELVGQRRDGTEFPIEITITKMPGPGPTRFVSVVRDITARKRLEQQAAQGELHEQELEHLRSMQEFKTQFINKTAHELATPLTPIRTQAHVLARRLQGHDDPLVQKEFILLNRNIERLVQLVDGIIDAAKLQSHGLGLDLHVVDLAEVTAACVERMRGLADVRGITIKATLAPELLVRADPTRLGQVITNLLSNAVRHNHPGGEARVEAYATNESVRLMVRDTGVGMTQAARKHLFTPFGDLFRAGESTTGAGLSLYISKGIMDLHRGQIWCQSDGPGRGAAFWISLPRYVPHALDGTAVAQHEAAGGSA